ncbi:MAG: RelA/SpoT domain-containing protein [Candidatus ainarchaeum sp.]|nr:RelA/SpoT domain-containing protein [Candidatus ainarchaeum sp.]
MNWIKPEYSKEQITAAGNVLINPASSQEQKEEAMKIMDNWRAAHGYPMHVFKIRLKSKANEVNKNALTAQRLKRVPAILYKLTKQYSGRKHAITLYDMQDIGGCRAIMPTVMETKRLYEQYYNLKVNLKHRQVKTNDYISKPKRDGYRSYHLVYEYYSDKKGKKIFNNGLLIELQFRSKLQHQWATAVEIAGFITKQAIKSNEGSEDWKEFFKLVSSAFAKNENLPIVPNTPNNEKELYLAIKKKEAELNVVHRLESWTRGINAMKNWDTKEGSKEKKNKRKQTQYFLLELNVAEETASELKIITYKMGEEKEAVEAYNNAEKKYHGQKQYDVVLVGVDTAKELEKAYPNYFADTREFLKELKKILNKY